MSNELFKTIEAQGRLITELRAENEQIRKKFNELGKLSMELVNYNYDAESTHYDEVIDENGEGGEDHIFHTLVKIQKLTN